MENFILVKEYLGGEKELGSPQSELDFIPIIRKGFRVTLIKRLSTKANLSEQTVCAPLPFSPRTLARRKQRAVRLKPMESEVLFRLARVLAAAHDVLGNGEKASKWLTTENRALGGVKPLELLDTGIGFQSVMDVLKRIEFGVHG